MTDDQIKTCDDLWREALAAGLVRYRLGMVTRGRHVIAGDDPLRVYTSGGVVRVSAADVRLDWPHPANGGWLLAMAREAVGTSDSYTKNVGVWVFEWTDDDAPYDVHTKYGDSEPEALLRAILATRG